jgi:hypothetical protein
MRLGMESTRRRIQIDPEQLGEAGPSRTASRARVRSLLAPFLCRDGCVVERLDTAQTTIESVRTQSTAGAWRSRLTAPRFE